MNSRHIQNVVFIDKHYNYLYKDYHDHFVISLDELRGDRQ